MPLNPPAYLGQDVWYSPNVYANMSPVALWKPPLNQNSILYRFTLPEPSAAPAPDPGFASSYNAAFLQQHPDAEDGGIPASPGASSNNPNGVVPPNPTSLKLPPGQTPYGTLISNLNGTYNQRNLWDGSGGATPEITKAFSDIGCGVSPFEWCAAYVGSMLYRSGIGGLKSSNAFDWEKFGKPIPTQDTKQWRTGDIAVWSYGHVNFILAPSSGGSAFYQGGNQRIYGSNRQILKEHQLTRGHNSVNQIIALRRGWEVPDSVTGPLITG